MKLLCRPLSVVFEIIAIFWITWKVFIFCFVKSAIRFRHFFRRVEVQYDIAIEYAR